MDILSGFFIGAGLKELRGGSPGRNIYSRDLRDDFVGLYIEDGLPPKLL